MTGTHGDTWQILNDPGAVLPAWEEQHPSVQAAFAAAAEAVAAVIVPPFP